MNGLFLNKNSNTNMIKLSQNSYLIMHKIILAFFFLIFTATYSKEVYVAKDGSNNNIGSKEKPFATIQYAVHKLNSGDICYIKKGTYHESVTIPNSGTHEAPISIKAYDDDLVILYGLEPINSKWTRIKKNIYKTTLEKNLSIEQVFNNNKMFFEARWPNLRFNDIWNRKKWANAETKSFEGTLYHHKLRTLNLHWTHTQAMLNVAHQFKTWSRPILQFDEMNSSFTYHFNYRLTTINPKPWNDDKFYLFGDLNLLDQDNEWYYDRTTGHFFIYSQKNPINQKLNIQYKNINYGLFATDLQNIVIEGINFFGCTFGFLNCDYLHVKNCKLLFPTYNRLLTDTYPIGERTKLITTQITGNNNKITQLGLAYTNTTGISIQGKNNLIENSIIHDVNWVGSLNYGGILLWDKKNENNGNNTIQNCTIYNTGNTAIYFRGKYNLIENNHIFNVGLACKDFSAIHTVNPSCEGSIIKGNHIHDSTEKAIRGDYQSRHLTILNNIIWNCNEGIITKGDYHNVSYNTIIGDQKHGVLLIPTKKELSKWWATTPPLNHQNSHSFYSHNLLGSIRFRKEPINDTGKIFGNKIINNKQLKELRQLLPKTNSQLKHSSLIHFYTKNNLSPPAKVNLNSKVGANWLFTCQEFPQ